MRHHRLLVVRIAVVALLLASAVAAGAVARRSGGAERRRTAPTTVPTTAPTTVPTTAPTTTAAARPPATRPPAISVTRVAPSRRPAPAPSGEATGVVTSPRGIVVPLVGRTAGGGYRVVTPCGRSALLASGTPVTRATVVLDAGHGGDEPGAAGASGPSEKVVNLAVARHAEAALERAGLATVLTRTADYRVTLGTRSKVAMALRPRAFVSIHHNAEPDGPRSGPGSETYYQVASADSKRLAGLVYEEVVRALSAYQVPWVADTDAGAKYRTSSSGDDYYGILRGTHGIPAVLAELAFVSNPPEADLLARADVQQAEGEAVARGVVRFLTTPDPGSGFVVPYPRTTPAGPGGGAAGCVDPPL